VSTNNSAVDALQRELIKAGKKSSRSAGREAKSEPDKKIKKMVARALKGGRV